MDHYIHTRYDDADRAYWECSCGHAGSTDAWRVDIASDKHIPEGERRIDTSRPF